MSDAKVTMLSNGSVVTLTGQLYPVISTPPSVHDDITMVPSIELVDKTINSLSVSTEAEWDCLFYTNKEGEVLAILNSYVNEIIKTAKLKNHLKQYINVKGDKKIYFYHPLLIEAVANSLNLNVNHITLEIAMGRWYNNIIDSSDEES